MLRRPFLRAALATGAALLTSVAVMPLGAGPAAAADNGLWSVFPTTVPNQLARPYFQPLLTPGVTVSDSVTITNKTNQALNLALYAADAFTTPAGGFASARPTDPKLDMGAWIHLQESGVTISANDTAVVPFTISPPTDATPGDHPGSIVAFNTVPTITHSGKVNIRSIQAVGTRVYGRVAGPVKPALDVTQLDVSAHGGVGGALGGTTTAKVTYQVTNTGNVRLTPQVSLSVSPLVGSSTKAKPMRLPEILPRGTVKVHQSISGVLPVGRLTAHVTVSSPAASTSADASTWAIPWLLILLLAAVIGGFWYWRHRRNRQLDEAASWAGLDAVKVP